MKVSIIVAVGNNNVIGKNNRLIWRMPADMKFFKDKTTGHCIVTGRKNYESIPEKFRPLPDRKNIVVTRQKNYPAPGAQVVNSIEAALDIAKKENETECFIIGGADIFSQSMDITDRIYITYIHQNFDGDTFFPQINMNRWKEVSRIDHPADEKNPYPYSFCVLEKI